MKKEKFTDVVLLLAMTLTPWCGVPLYSASGPTTPVQESVPLYKVTVVQNSAKAINYRYLKSSTDIDFKGTVLLADAKGTAEIKSKAGVTEIDARFEKLPAATQFGPEYLTYVLWSISPDGRPNNLGELILDNGKSRLSTTEKLQTFGLIVTAEPYFAVTGPSNVVVLENAIRKDTKGKVESIDAKYDLLERGQYRVNIAPADLGLAMDPAIPLSIYEARNAIRISKAAGAERYAPEGLLKAETLLAQAEAPKGNAKEKAGAAREAVQRAEDARAMSLKRQGAENLASERLDSKNQMGLARAAAQTAAAGQAQAELAQDKADAGRVVAEAAATSAVMAKNQANAERNVAVGQAERAESEKAALRAQLLTQLNAVLQTRDSARGLIVNMSGVLFETGKYALAASGREKLSKISGIVMSHPGLKLEVEGHTDNVGGDTMNQTLSEKRAESAKQYLIQQGVASSAVVSRGFGSTQPTRSNETADGRQSNRRVELIVSGDAIRMAVKAENR